MRHVPYWFDKFPKTRRPSYPRLRGSHEARVVIVGGGLTGCGCALAFASAGVRVMLLEAESIAAGATAGADGLLREGFGGSFQQTAAQHGLKTTKLLWEGMRRGSLDLAATLRRLKIRCELTPMDILTIASSSSDAVKQLRRSRGRVETRVRMRAGWLLPLRRAKPVSRSAVPFARMGPRWTRIVRASGWQSPRYREVRRLRTIRGEAASSHPHATLRSQPPEGQFTLMSSSSHRARRSPICVHFAATWCRPACMRL